MEFQGRVIIESREEMVDTSGRAPAEYELWLEGAEGGLRVTAGAFFQHEAGSSGAWVCDPAGAVITSGWSLGVELGTCAAPAYVFEGRLLHALHLIESWLSDRNGVAS